MPKFVPKPKKSLGRSGRLWENARKTCLQRSTICWICAGKCPDLQWDALPFGTAAIDMTIQWPHPASASVDHEIPISQLEPNDPRLWSQDYLHPAHLKCNSKRGDGGQRKRVLVRTSRDWLA